MYLALDDGAGKDVSIVSSSSLLAAAKVTSVDQTTCLRMLIERVSSSSHPD